MKRTPILIAVALATIFFVSCKNSGTTGLPIPKDAAMVLHINTSSLSSKLTWKEIQETNWFKDMHEKQKEDSLTKKIMENPEASGLDLKSDFAFFIKKQGQGGYMVFEGGIKDAAAFEATLKKMHEGVTVEKDGDLNYVKNHDNLVSWNSSRFIVMNDAPMFAMMNPYGMGSDNQESHSFGPDSLKKFTHDLLNLSSDNNIEKDERFASLIKESGDAHFWINTDEYTSSMAGGYLSMMKLGSLFQGNVATFTMNFDNGKVSVKTTQYYGKEMTKMMEQYHSKNVDAALINRIPSQNVAGALAVNIDPQFIKGSLKSSGMDGMANGFLGKV